LAGSIGLARFRYGAIHRHASPKKLRKTRRGVFAAQLTLKGPNPVAVKGAGGHLETARLTGEHEKRVPGGGEGRGNRPGAKKNQPSR